MLNHVKTAAFATRIRRLIRLINEPSNISLIDKPYNKPPFFLLSLSPLSPAGHLIVGFSKFLR